MANSPAQSVVVGNSNEWAIPQPSRLKYTQLFNQHDRSRSGFLSGLQCRDILLPSGLPQQTLAQIWNLSDIDNDGQLTREEFLLAMYLTDSVKSGCPLPQTLPADLVPPSYRRNRTMSSSSIQSTASADDANSVDSTESAQSIKSGASAHTFEDKRRENYEKGQAELERRRLQLLDQQRREHELRERKEREELERREKLRQEAERKRIEELEKQQKKVRQMELEREERKRIEMEKRESARREMERQRQMELDALRQQELMQKSQQSKEIIEQLKQQKVEVANEMEKINSEFATLKNELISSRDQVAQAKAKIDSMRTARDTKMGLITSLRAQLKTVQDKRIFLEREELQILEIAKDLNLNFHTSIGGKLQLSELDQKRAIEDKKNAIGEMKSKIEQLTREKEQKSKQKSQYKQQIDDIVVQLKVLADAANEAFQRYQETLERAKSVREQCKSNAQTLTDPNAFWDSTGASNNFSNPVDDPWLSSVATVVEAKPTKGNLETAASSIDHSFDDAFDRLAISSSSSATTVQAAANQNQSVQSQPTPHQDLGGSNENLEFCVSLYPFSKTEPYDLEFDANEYIRVLKKEGDWWTGRVVGHPEREGMFPSNYTRLLEYDEVVALNLEHQNQQDSTNTGVFSVNQGQSRQAGFDDPWTSATDAPKNKGEPQTETSSKIIQNSSVTGAKEIGEKGQLHRMSSVGSLRSKKARQRKQEVATVVAPYRALGPEQMSLEKGQLVVIRRKMDTGWWEGEIQLKGKKKQYGWFPASYVKLLAPSSSSSVGGTGTTSSQTSGSESGQESFDPSTDDTQPQQSQPPQPQKDLEKVIAMYKFSAQHDDEISFEPGDVIMVLSKNDDSTWWKGMLMRTGETGLFPSNHVEIQNINNTSPSSNDQKNEGKGLEQQV